MPSDGGRDVLSELAHVTNQMLERIQTLVGGMRGALDSVAHDLRTPIARLRSRAEAGACSPRATRLPAARRSRTSSRNRIASRRC